MNRHGDFIWYELMTPDPDAAQAFYGEVVGWKARGSGQPGMDYRLLAAPDGADVAGVMPMPEGADMPPAWFGYVGVDDVDAAIERLKAAGGAVHMPAWDVPGVGRMAFVADPQGLPFYLMRGEGEGSAAFAPGRPGHCSWNELNARDDQAALDFYTGLFGWRRGEAMDMGEMGDYRFVHSGEPMIGAVMKAPPGAPPSWTFYFQVDDLDAAIERTKAAGGRVQHGPTPIPGDERMFIGVDAQGASFALVGK